VREGLTHLDTAIGLFKTNPNLAGVAGRPRPTCRLPHDVGVQPVDLGFPDRAVERADAAISLSDQLGNPYTSAYARFHSGFLHLWRREPELVLDRAIRLQEIADEYDFQVWSAIGSCLLGAAQTGLGLLDEGLADRARAWPPTRESWRRRCSCRCSSSWTPAREPGGRPAEALAAPHGAPSSSSAAWMLPG
jgi:hypothetical protein